jgi:4-hydroxybenzoate polyprenyltransferase
MALEESSLARPLIPFTDGKGAEVLDRLRLLRLHHWAKNLFVFAPAFFSLRLFDPVTMGRSALAALAFGLASSGMYALNDILDRECDRRHSSKSERPVASGKVRIPEAAFLSIFSVVSGGVLGWFLSPACFLALAAYLSINILYSFHLKHLPIIDVFCVASGFPLRVAMGGLATGISLSHWIQVMTFLLALFLALAKRRDDLLLVLRGDGQGRKSLEGYNFLFLNAAMVLSASVLLVAYLMYALDSSVMAKAGTTHLYVTFLFVLMGVLRYLQLAFVKNDSGSPTTHFYRDPVLRFVMAGWAGLFLLLLYGPVLHLFD